MSLLFADMISNVRSSNCLQRDKKVEIKSSSFLSNQQVFSLSSQNIKIQALALVYFADVFFLLILSRLILACYI